MEQTELNRLIEAVTKRIMQQLGAESAPRKRILVLGKDPACPIATCLNRDFIAETGLDLSHAGEYDFVVLPSNFLERMRECGPGTSGNNVAAGSKTGGATLDFTGHRLLHERELRDKCTAAIDTLRVGKRTMITSLAADYIRKRGLTVLREA